MNIWLILPMIVAWLTIGLFIMVGDEIRDSTIIFAMAITFPTIMLISSEIYYHLTSTTVLQEGNA